MVISSGGAHFDDTIDGCCSRTRNCVKSWSRLKLSYSKWRKVIKSGVFTLLSTTAASSKHTIW